MFHFCAFQKSGGRHGICKGTIVTAIKDGATDPGAIRASTKASASCGSCTGLVEQLLANSLGGEFVAATARPVCGCTGLTHEDVRRIIKSLAIKTMAGVMQKCGWKTSCGCHLCRPALNHYMIAEWPLDYLDDVQCRLVNERNHANIQKDGTYSVLPRMLGGMTTPD